MEENSKGERRNPWWAPRFLFGPLPDIAPRRITLLGCVMIALFYENYDLSLLYASLKQIAEALQIGETELGFFTAKIRFAGVLGILIIPLSDLIGRRRLLLLSIIVMSVGTSLTAFSRTPEQFILFQMATRGFMLTATAMAVVIVTEEFPPHSRGWGIGMLGAAAVAGNAVGTLLYAGIDWLPYGWRALYFIGLLPVFRLPMFRGGIYETRRYEEHRREKGGPQSLREAFGGWFRPYLDLARNYPIRLCGITIVGSFSACGFAVVFSFIGYFLLSYRGLEPWQYSAVLIICGSVVIPGTALTGQLSDRIGRRPTGFFFLSTFALTTWIFFNGPGWSLYFSLVFLVVSGIAANVILMALAAELFPTALRGTSSGLVGILGTTGAGLGLLAVGLLTSNEGDLVTVVPIVSATTLVSAFLLLLFPETGGRELEEIAADNLSVAPRDKITLRNPTGILDPEKGEIPLEFGKLTPSLNFLTTKNNEKK